MCVNFVFIVRHRLRFPPRSSVMVLYVIVYAFYLNDTIHLYKILHIIHLFQDRSQLNDCGGVH
jgi:hypothetical protein